MEVWGQLAYSKDIGYSQIHCNCGNSRFSEVVDMKRCTFSRLIKNQIFFGGGKRFICTVNSWLGLKLICDMWIFKERLAQFVNLWSIVKPDLPPKIYESNLFFSFILWKPKDFPAWNLALKKGDLKFPF